MCLWCLVSLAWGHALQRCFAPLGPPARLSPCGRTSLLLPLAPCSAHALRMAMAHVCHEPGRPSCGVHTVHTECPLQVLASAPLIRCSMWSAHDSFQSCC